MYLRIRKPKSLKKKRSFMFSISQVHVPNIPVFLVFNVSNPMVSGHRSYLMVFALVLDRRVKKIK